jgi:serine/threonine-protein kinase
MPAEPEVGASIGGYRLEGVLGEGAMGVVYKAVGDSQTVALKVLKPALSEDDVFRRRFAHEARAAAAVRHRHLVPILEAGEAEGRQYLAVSYVSGGSLDDRLERDRTLPLEDLLSLAADVAAGLDALHRQGLVHRDVKPSNIMLEEDGTAALTDFGLAKGPAYTVLTKPGQVMGTLDYLAPELIRGEEASPASDIYALGCVVYECIAGAPPFGGKSMFEVGAAHLQEEPSDPASARDDFPAGVSWAVVQALAKNPAGRPPTATAYSHLLRTAAR